MNKFSANIGKIVHRNLRRVHTHLRPDFDSLNLHVYESAFDRSGLKLDKMKFALMPKNKRTKMLKLQELHAGNSEIRSFMRGI